MVWGVLEIRVPFWGISDNKFPVSGCPGHCSPCFGVPLLPGPPSDTPLSQWARDEFEGLFKQPAENVNQYLM